MRWRRWRWGPFLTGVTVFTPIVVLLFWAAVRLHGFLSLVAGAAGTVLAIAGAGGSVTALLSPRSDREA